MYLIDSNILIYSYEAERQYLRNLFGNDDVFVSEISRIEVLGYHKLTSDEELYFQEVFDLLPIILPDQRVFNKAIALRKEYNLKLGDSLIAATAMEYHLLIYTRNINDFEKVNGLRCINPVL